jgi:Sigma-70 region 2
VAGSGDTLLRIATLLTCDPHLAEDVYQETLQRLAARWSRIDNPMAFCRPVLHNLVIDQGRARSRRPAELAMFDAFDSTDPRAGDPLQSVELRPVLAATPGIVVNEHARDSIGRAAVEISRYDRQYHYTNAVFESPDASRVLETASIHAPTKPAGGLPGEAGYNLNDTYLSIVRTDKLPTKDPYRR